MANEKFLDREGVKYLCSKLSLEDYPNNEMLMAVLDAIDETKADKDNVVLLTQQNLTEEQKAQVKNNLGLTSSNDNSEDVPSVEEPQEPITTEYVYTYDGDRESDANTWITNYGGTRIFAKMGEIPEGELNLVGATLFRTNPSNQWLDRTITITEDHLNETVTKSSTEIPATQPGLIQIFDQHNSDWSKMTVLCICTEPGWYNITFDDWYEIIDFPETGIYGYDKRTYGGNDYLKSFTFSATVTPSEGSSGGSTGGNSNINTNPSSPIHYTGNEIQMFSRGICIGDSVTDGSFDGGDNGTVIRKFSYPAILKRLTNIDIANAGIAGATSGTWYSASLNSDDLWGKWLNDEWVWDMNPTTVSTDTVSSELNYSNFDFAIIHLGINDLGMKEESVTVDEAIAAFETNINNIISKLKTNNKGIKIFLATIIPSYAPATNAGYTSLNNKIKAIVDANENLYLLDLNKYSEIANHTAYNRTHPTALGYHKLANEIAAYISYIIRYNLDEFESVQFIGTDYV